ncbi:FAD-binding dehydrogenase, partial [Achromobacter xylosoxidans]
MEGITWDKEVDALVVGSGAGGMAAALTAREEGLDVLLVEKTGRIGGSTAISGGALWIPLNAQTEAAGHPDSFEKVWTYLEQTVGAAAPDDMKRAYLEAGPRMMDYLVSRGILDLAARTASPDYYPDLPGAAMGGRSLDPLEFDGRKLGGDFRFLRDPLKEFTVLGGMMVNITDVR